jgi:S-adenosylmethionine synthetase
MPKFVITGASGFLGSAVYDAFKRSSTFQVVGLTHSRQIDGMKQLDLLDESKVEGLFTQLDLAEGDWVIHCAAERRPDVAEKVSFLMNKPMIGSNCCDLALYLESRRH